MSIVAALDKVLFFNASSKYSVLRMKTEDSSVPAEARSPYRYLLSVCYVFVMSLIIFWLNLRISKVLSYLAAVLVHVAGYILTIGFLTDSYRKFSLLANSLLMYHNINGSEVETAYLALPQSFLVYAAVAVMLFLLILHAIHSYDFRITVGTKQ